MDKTLVSNQNFHEGIKFLEIHKTYQWFGQIENTYWKSVDITGNSRNESLSKNI